MRIRTKNAICVIALFSYLKPYNASLIGPINIVYSLLKIVATLALLVIIYEEGINISKASKYALAFLCLWTTSIIINNNGSMGGNFQTILSILGMMLLCSILASTKHGLEKMIHYISIFAKVYFLLHLLTIIMDHPILASAGVSYDKFFLGSDNYSAFAIIPLCGFIFADEGLRRSRISLQGWFFAFLGFLCLLIPVAVTGMIAYFLLMVLAIMVDYPQIRKMFSARNMLIICAVFVFSIAIFRADVLLEKVLSLIGKSGLNSRNVIWPFAIKAFLKRPLIGYGSLTQEQISAYILYGASHTHNIVLEFLFDTGIIGAILALLWAKNTFQGMKKTRDRAMQYLLLCISALIVCSIFDFYISLIYFWMLLFVLDYYKLHLQRKNMT